MEAWFCVLVYCIHESITQFIFGVWVVRGGGIERVHPVVAAIHYGKVRDGASGAAVRCDGAVVVCGVVCGVVRD